MVYGYFNAGLGEQLNVVRRDSAGIALPPDAKSRIFACDELRVLGNPERRTGNPPHSPGACGLCLHVAERRGRFGGARRHQGLRILS